jgi:hypothetical protein
MELLMAKPQQEEIARLVLSAPADLFARLDRWRLQQPGTLKPSRPASIRWIVHHFLRKQEQKASRVKPRKRHQRGARPRV